MKFHETAQKEPVKAFSGVHGDDFSEKGNHIVESTRGQDDVEINVVKTIVGFPGDGFGEEGFG